MTTTFDTVTVLRTAANLLEERGWHPIGLGTSGGPLSLMGALAEAAGLDETDPDLMTSPYVAAYHSVLDHLEVTEGSAPTLGLWNVSPGRTQGEAVTLLRSVALAHRLRPPA